MNTARRAALAVLVLMTAAAARSQDLESLKAQSYGDFASLLRPAQLSQVRAAGAPPSVAGRPVRTEEANRRPQRRSPWTIWQVVSRLERSGVRVDHVYQSKASNMFGGYEKGWGLSTSLGEGDAVILAGARDAETLQVRKWRCLDSGSHCYVVQRSGKTVASLHGGNRRLYFVMRRNVFFFTSDHALYEAVKKALAD